MPVRTDKSGRSLLGLVFLLAFISCSRFSAEKVYHDAWSACVAGDLSRAAKLAADGEARWRSNRNSPWYWSLRLLLAETLTAQSNRKAAIALLKDPLPTAPLLAQLEARRLMDLALAGVQPKESTAQLLERARAIVTEPDLQMRLGIIDAAIALGQKRTSDARTAAQSAADLAQRYNDPYWEAQALSALSACAKSQRQYEEAIAFGLKALSAAERIGARRTAAFAHGNLGSTYVYLGNLDAARDHQQQAIRILDGIGARSNLMIALGELGITYDYEDDSAKALEIYRRAYELANELGSNRDAGRFASNIALTYIKAKQWDAAEEWNNRAGQVATDATAALIERNRARIAFGRGRMEEAAAICHQLLAAKSQEPFIRWEAYYLLGEIDAAAKRYRSADRNFESALRIILENRAELIDPQNRITLLSRLITFYQTYVDTLVDQNDNAHALRVVESSRAQVLSERLGRELKAGEFDSDAAFQKAAASTHAAILSFWIAHERSFVWLITEHDLKRFQLPGSGEITQLVTQYRDTVEHSLRDPIAAGVPAGPALWQALVAQVAPHIPKGSRLIVVPDGPLHRLNLETLVAPGPAPHYWIEDVETALSPSITIAASPAAGTAAAAPELLVIGSPNYAGTGYDPLPNAAGEIRSIESHFGNWKQKVYEGAEASPAAYRQSDPSRFALIHFAAHAEANYERPLESSIVLSKGKLFARDVTDTPIHASLVTISGCRSAGTHAYAGEGLLGFAWAFLNAGARAVIAGLWDVSDSSTGQLMDKLYAGIAAGEDPVAALRAAKLSLLNGPAAFRKPFYWAPFQVYLGAAGK
jgi:CHAT domain-containing protein